MANFADLFEYNDWANQQVLAVTDTMSSEELSAPMPELGGSALELLSHTARVESAFLALLLNDQSLVAPRQQEYAGVRATFAAVAAAFREHTAAFSARLDEPVFVPWFERPFSTEQVLTQVATHSVQHRAGVCAGIARAGKEAPGLDYIMWLSEFR